MKKKVNRFCDSERLYHMDTGSTSVAWENRWESTYGDRSSLCQQAGRHPTVSGYPHSGGGDGMAHGNNPVSKSPFRSISASVTAIALPSRPRAIDTRKKRVASSPS
jgi:hypothetical protein